MSEVRYDGGGVNLAVKNGGTGVAGAPSGWRRHVRRFAGVATAAVSLLGVACQPPEGSGYERQVGPFTIGVITEDPTDKFSIVEPAPNAVTVNGASTNRYWTTRLAIIHRTAETSIDQSSCVTWNGPDISSIQPGVVLRTQTAPGRTRAIMVTDNIMFGVRQTVNVHTVDTNNSPAYTQVGRLMSSLIGEPTGNQSLPWRFCAKATGRHLQVKAWPTSTPEPDWSDTDPSKVLNMELPADTVFAGKPGVYTGHIGANQTAELTDRATATVTGGPGHAYWTSARAWSDATLAMVATGGNPNPGGPSGAPASVVDALAQQVSHGNAAIAASGAAAGDNGRKTEASRVHAIVMGKPGMTSAMRGRTAIDYASDMMASPSFSGGKTDAQFVRAVYEQVLGRTPSAATIANGEARVRASGRRAYARTIYGSAEHSTWAARAAAQEVWGRAPTSAEVTDIAARYRALGRDGGFIRAELAAASAPAFGS